MINEKLDNLKKSKESSNVGDMKKALEEINSSWSQVASKLHQPEEPNASEQGAKSEDTKKNKSKDEIEDADFEVVD